MSVISKVEQFYATRIAEHGVSYKAAWGCDKDNRAQERFKIIEKSDIHESDTLVDLGCGTGILRAYLTHINLKCNYIAVDVVEDFLSYVSSLYTCTTLKIDFINCIDSLPDAEWYTIFGSLNKKWLLDIDEANNNIKPAYDLLQRLFNKARKGLFFSMFSDKALNPKPSNIHLNPIKVLSDFEDIKSYKIRHDNDFHEFTMMIKK